MALKGIILGISLVLMFVVIVLCVAGYAWSVNASTPPPIGGRVVLALSGAAAIFCIGKIWVTRHDHLR